MKKSSCDNCHWTGTPTIGLPAIPNLNERLDAGSVVPSGECPQCGALCYLVNVLPASCRKLKPTKNDVILRIAERSWLEIQEAAEHFAETFPAETTPRQKIFQALLRVKHILPRVRIDVIGGVAHQGRTTPGVRVTIKDHD